MDTPAAWLSLNLIRTCRNLIVAAAAPVTESADGVMVSRVITSPRRAGEALGLCDLVGVGAGVLVAGVLVVGVGAGVLVAGVLLGVGAGGAALLEGPDTGVPLADWATAARHAWIDALVVDHHPGEPGGIEQRAEQSADACQVAGDIGQPLRLAGRRAEGELGEAKGQSHALRGGYIRTHEFGGRSLLRGRASTVPLGTHPSRWC